MSIVAANFKKFKYFPSTFIPFRSPFTFKRLNSRQAVNRFSGMLVHSFSYFKRTGVLVHSIEDLLLL